MKKFIALICAAVIGIVAANADPSDRGNLAVGVHINYGNLTESFGFGVRGQYNIIDHLRGEFAFNYFSKHNHLRAWDLNLNAHYMVNLWNNRLYIYPLAGLNYTMATWDAYEGNNYEKDEENHLGLNLGAGAEFAVMERLSTFIEYRHTIERKIDQGVFSLGATYRF